MKKFSWRTLARQRVLQLFAIAFVIFGFTSAASAIGVKTDAVKPAEVQSGTYNVITTSTPAPIAILQRVGAPYDIKLATAGPDYTVTSGLTQAGAINAADDYLKKDAAVLKTDVKEIKGPDGSVIGYEVTPVYRPLRWGSAPDITGTSYKASGDKVFAYVTADQLAQNELMGGG